MEWYFMKPNRTKQSNFINAAHRLEEAVVDYRNIPNDTVRDGLESVKRIYAGSRYGKYNAVSQASAS